MCTIDIMEVHGGHPHSFSSTYELRVDKLYLLMANAAAAATLWSMMIMKLL